MTTTVTIERTVQVTVTVIGVPENGSSPPAEASAWTTTGTLLEQHNIVTDNSGGTILPWYSPGNRGASFDYIIRLVWEFWYGIGTYLSEPYHYNVIHMIYDPGTGVGTGGDQLAMALRSWKQLYAYWGDSRILTDMQYIADTYLAHSLSAGGDSWPNIPYPYQTGSLATWNGDYIAGSGYTQPDKAGSFGYELLNLYKITGTAGYLTAAVNIANTLATKTAVGDGTNSPLPYRVRTSNGSVYDTYTANYAAILRLWDDLTAMGQGNDYSTAKARIIAWWKANPIVDNGWGPFFEDISAYSDAACVALKAALYIMDKKTAWDASWATHARSILDYVKTLDPNGFGNNGWSAYGVRVTNEQTQYQLQGQSHSSHDASVELRYAEVTGSTTEVANSIRQLSWATYMVDSNGHNNYPTSDIWMTDGYGDYVGYYLEAMAAAPYLAPANQDHILRSSSVVKSVTYGTGTISYETYDAASREKARVTTFTPLNVTAGGTALTRRYALTDLDTLEGWTYNVTGGLDTELNIRHNSSGVIVVT